QRWPLIDGAKGWAAQREQVLGGEAEPVRADAAVEIGLVDERGDGLRPVAYAGAARKHLSGVHETVCVYRVAISVARDSARRMSAQHRAQPLVRQPEPSRRERAMRGEFAEEHRVLHP